MSAAPRLAAVPPTAALLDQAKAPAARSCDVPTWDEVGNAEFFAKVHTNDLRFDHRRRRWLLWQPPVWTPDAEGHVHQLAKAAMRERLRRAADLEDELQRRRAVSWCNNSMSKARLDNLLALAESEPPLADAGDQWDMAPWLLACTNGVVDLQTGTLRPSRPEDRLTRRAAVPYVPSAPCPRWQQFLDEVFPDAALAAFVQRALGYSVTGVTTEQVLFLLYGTGANGKSTLLRTIHEVLGGYAHVAPFAAFTDAGRTQSIPNDLAALDGPRFVVASETRERTRLDEGRLKSLTGGDPISARFLHQEYFTFTPRLTLWLSVNHKPTVTDDSHGFWRRVRLVPCLARFDIPDPTLGDSLRGEGPGILAWLVQGCLAWQRDGLAPPTVVTQATLDYQQESDTLGDFLTQACDPDEHAVIAAGELFQHYLAWCRTQGITDREILSSTLFGRKVGERLPSERTRAGKLYHGLARRPL